MTCPLRALLKEKWEEAVDLIIAGSGDGAPSYRKTWRDTKDPEKTMGQLENRHYMERIVLRSLARRPDDFFGAVQSVSGLLAFDFVFGWFCLRRLSFSDHCWRSKSEVVSDLVLWEPKDGKRSIGGQAGSFVDVLEVDTRIPRDGLPAGRDDRVGWGKIGMGGGRGGGGVD